MKKIDDIIAIVGPTASGKSDLALKLAKENSGVILSVDSLSVYKEIDIASAKPTKEELAEVKHFGIDVLYPDESFDVIRFLDEFRVAKSYAKQESKKLIIVGGSSFYLKVLVDGISKMPKISSDIKRRVADCLVDIERAYEEMLNIDREYMSKIAKGDRYRLERAYQIFYATSLKPSQYFKENRAKAVEPDLKIYEIKVDRATLRERVEKRTKKMLELGLIDEVAYLEHRYTREPNSMKSIGIKEVLDYFDGKLNKIELEQKIVINTMRLAKRQVTFNKSQLNTLWADFL